MKHAVLYEMYMAAAAVFSKAAQSLSTTDPAGFHEAMERLEEMQQSAVIHQAAYLETPVGLRVVRGGRGA